MPAPRHVSRRWSVWCVRGLDPDGASGSTGGPAPVKRSLRRSVSNGRLGHAVGVYHSVGVFDADDAGVEHSDGVVYVDGSWGITFRRRITLRTPRVVAFCTHQFGRFCGGFGGVALLVKFHRATQPRPVCDCHRQLTRASLRIAVYDGPRLQTERRLGTEITVVSKESNECEGKYTQIR
jgi:hypothetical protein